MALTGASPPDTSFPSLLGRIDLRLRRGWYGSATQSLWNKLENDASLYELCAASKHLTDEDRAILEQCRQKLEVARRCLDKPFSRWSFSFWAVIHEVDGLLLLVMPRHMLLPKALEIQQQFEQRVKDGAERRLWLGEAACLGPLPLCVQRLASVNESPGGPAPASSPHEEPLAHCRHVLRGALGIVNEQVDKTFWQLSINVALQVLSTTLLVALFLVAFLAFQPALVESWPDQLVPDGMLLVALAGAAGAILSNMLSKERFVVATGATSRYFAYHLLVKPTVGAFAALMLLFLEQSHLLLAVVPRESAGGENPAILQIVVSNWKAAFFALAALSVVAGYSADKLLSSIMDNMLQKLLRQSEKLLPPTTPPPDKADTKPPE